MDVPFERRADSVRLEHLVPIDRLTTLPAALSGNTGTNRETRAVRQIEANDDLAALWAFRLKGTAPVYVSTFDAQRQEFEAKPVHDLRRGSAHWN